MESSQSFTVAVTAEMSLAQSMRQSPISNHVHFTHGERGKACHLKFQKSQYSDRDWRWRRDGVENGGKGRETGQTEGERVENQGDAALIPSLLTQGTQG